LAIVLAAGELWHSQRNAPEQERPLPVAAVGEPVTTSDVPTMAARVEPLVPTRVAIPRIEVDADVVRLGLNPDGTLEVPSDFSQAGWWSGGSRPGEPGPAVIAGHFDSRSGPAVFYRLTELAPGDIITVSDDTGNTLRFTVERLEQHDKDRFPTDVVYGPTDEPTLRLITCGGSFDGSTRSYRDNVIVFASLETVGPRPGAQAA
jgi:sortase (surface protein transpeptidase)